MSKSYRNLSITAFISVILISLIIVMAGFEDSSSIKLKVKDDLLLIINDDQSLHISLNSPVFEFDVAKAGINIQPHNIHGDIHSDKLIKVTYAPIPLNDSVNLDVELFMQWVPEESVLHKWTRFRLNNKVQSFLLKEIVLENMSIENIPVELNEEKIRGYTGSQSYPAFVKGFFLGIEFPIASTRIDCSKLILSHRPGLRMKPGVWYESQKAVYGVTSKGEEKNKFKQYIASHRPGKSGIHFNYNSWWTSPMPYTENDILELMKTFEERLYKPHKVSFNTFCIDEGWANPESIYEINEKLFPEGFTRIREAAKKMNTNLGIWIGPDGRYSTLNTDWAKEQGYETYIESARNLHLCCLGGERYASKFRENLVDLVKRYEIRDIKLDHYHGECHESDHGHEPGPLSAEALAKGLIAALEAVRKVAPDIWFEGGCFGWNPSPWWLLYVNSVIGTYGDDSPRGRVPAPVYAESKTSARDYFNLQGADMNPVPIAAQHYSGSIIHQTRDPFLNDAVTAIMRGNEFIPIYLNPAYMDDSRWKDLADIMKWARKNGSTLSKTQPLLPVSWQDDKQPRYTDEPLMPREPYGYAHWKDTYGLVALRNPWIKPGTFILKLDESTGLSQGIRNLRAVSLYPEVRVYARELSFGERLNVSLAPYETLILSIGQDQSVTGLPSASEEIGGQVKATMLKQEVKNVNYDNVQNGHLGSNWTSLVGDNSSAVHLNMDMEVSITAPQAEFMVLMEGDKKSPAPVESKCLIKIDDKEVPFEVNASDVGWGQRSRLLYEHWIFLKAPLPQGKSQVSLNLISACDRLSVWVWATKPIGAAMTYPNALPSPELISLDAARLGEQIIASDIPSGSHMPWPVERIDGIFLDALDPLSAQPIMPSKNQNIGLMPITIAGKRYLRGLGTHSRSQIVYSLKGEYRRFQSLAGVDITANVATRFIVLVDGQKKWESGLMDYTDIARYVDIDVTGAQMLELITESGKERRVIGGGRAEQHDKANWPEAKLLR